MIKKLLLLPLLGVVPGASQPQNHTVVIAHRGEHLQHPENTLPAYQAAADAGADFFETDVRTSKDGELVIMHNSTLDGTTDGHGKISDLPLSEIEKLDAGSRFSSEFQHTRVPLFAEVLALAAKAHIGVYVDTKEANAGKLVATILENHMEDHVVIYGSDELLANVRKIDPKLVIMPEAGDLNHVEVLLQTLHPTVIAFEESDFKQPIIDLVRRNGIAIYVDRLGDQDQPAFWAAAVAAGASGIQTNRPAEVVRYLRQIK